REPLQASQHGGGGPEEERPAYAINDDIAVGRLRSVVTVSIGLIRDVFERGASAVDLDRFRHSMQEKKCAEDDADGDSGHKVDEYRQQESANQAGRVAARGTQQ